MPKTAGKVLALFVSDIHLCHTAPTGRSTEVDWYAAMKRNLDFLKLTQRRLEGISGRTVPVICAGDIFDKWNAPPKLINFAIDNLPHMFAIPGQHDLPNHRNEDIKSSAYWTLVQAGKIAHVADPMLIGPDHLIRLFPFPWGADLRKRPKRKKSDATTFDIAMVHKYLWHRESKYPGAPKEASVSRQRTSNILGSYDAVVVGDNHKHFISKNVYNCGNFIRRKRDEKDNVMAIGKVMTNGKFGITPIPDTEDSWASSISPKAEMSTATAAFVEQLATLGMGAAFDYIEAVKRFLETDQVGQDIKTVLREFIEDEDR